MTILAFQSATALAAKVRSREIGCRELLEYFVARADKYGAAVNAIVVRDPERARSRAVEESGTHARRIFGRLGGSAGRRTHGARVGKRHRFLHSQSRPFLRCLRSQADVRPVPAAGPHADPQLSAVDIGVVGPLARSAQDLQLALSSGRADHRTALRGLHLPAFCTVARRAVPRVRATTGLHERLVSPNIHDGGVR